MDLYTLPTDFAELSDSQLESRLSEINKYGAKIAAEDSEFNIDTPAEDGKPSGLEVAESLASARTEVETLLDMRREEATAAAARREAALAALAPAEPEAPAEEPEPEAPAAELAAEEAPAAEPVAEELAAEPEPAPEPAPVEEVPAPVVEAPAELAAEPEPTPEPAPAPKDAAQALQQASRSRSASEMARTNTENTAPNGVMRAVGSMTADGFQAGDWLNDTDKLSEYMSKKLSARDTSQHVGSPQRITLMSAQFDHGDDMLVGNDSERNFKVLDRAGRAYQDEQMALVAAGGPCAPLLPSYDFTNCWSVQRPVDAMLPKVGAPRGGIKWLNQIPLGTAEAVGAITQKDATDSALLPGQPGYTDKNCTRVSCPTESEITVGSISWCVTFDNLNFRVFPEQVRDMLERVQLEYTKIKEQFYLGRIDQIAGAATPIPASPYGAGRSLYQELRTIGHNYRKRNNMGTNDILDVMLPTVVEEQLAVDMTNDADMSAIGTVQAGPSGNLTQVLANKARLNVGFYYYDATTGGFPPSAHDQAAGAYNTMPTVFRSYIHAPGAIVGLDGGQMDLGIVRDSTLNGQNDLQMFAEEWLEVADPGCEVSAFDHTACYNGAGPAGVVPATC